MDDVTLIARLCEKLALGSLISEPAPLIGGYMHRMYRADTASGTYAIKLLNPEVMSRPQAMANYARAEHLEHILEENQIPAVTALTFSGRKMQAIDGRYAYIFPWFNGRTLPWDAITQSHCQKAGELLAKLHRIPMDAAPVSPDEISCDWESIIPHLPDDLANAVTENLPLLVEAQSAYNHALASLPPVFSITNGDMDCKNVMWDKNGSHMIDLECLDIGSPVSDMMILAFSWAGGTTCALNPDHLDAFISSYSEISGPIKADLTALYPLGYSWLDWLFYNLRRAAGLVTSDPAEIAMGISESRATLDRIIHHHKMKDAILPCLAKWRTGE